MNSREMLHKGNRRTAVEKTVHETEAETIAFVVAQSLQCFWAISGQRDHAMR
jgi:hypothetical protein